MAERSNKDSAVEVGVPKSAIVYSRAQTESRVELWSIQEGRLVNPRGLTKKALIDLYETIKPYTPDRKTFFGSPPEGLVWMNDRTLVLHRPPGEMQMLLNEEEKKTRRIMAPAMVLRYTGPEHDVFAYWCKGSKSDVASGKPVLTPMTLPNISESGDVCLGSSMFRVPAMMDMGKMAKAVWRSFLQSEFNEWRRPIISRIVEAMSSLGKDDDPQRLISGESGDKELDDYFKPAIRWISLSQIVRTS